jgi:hypothetical protein
MHSSGPRTNAPINVMTMDANKSTVATTLTGLNIVFNCFLKPLMERQIRLGVRESGM